MDTTMLIPMLERLGWTKPADRAAGGPGVWRMPRAAVAVGGDPLPPVVAGLAAGCARPVLEPAVAAGLVAGAAGVAMSATDVAADMVYPLAPEASAQLLAAMPMPAADVPAVAWWAVALATLWMSGVLLMALRTSVSGVAVARCWQRPIPARTRRWCRPCSWPPMRTACVLRRGCG